MKIRNKKTNIKRKTRIKVRPFLVRNESKCPKYKITQARTVISITMGISKTLVMLTEPIPKAVRISHIIAGIKGQAKSTGFSTFFEMAITHIGI